MASDLGEEMDTETEISGDIRGLLPRDGSVNAYIWFPFGRNESEQNEDDGATRSKTREIQVVCFAYIFLTTFENVFLYFVIQTRATDRLSLFVCSPVHASLPAVGRKRHEAKVARAGMLT